MGLRAGNTALNLTAANRVILIDPWWNDTAESQAFGRVKRIGQTKETHFVRILCNTVDNIINKMQIVKSTKISYALQDDGHTPVEVDEDRMTKLFMDPAQAKKNQNKKFAMCDSKEGGHGVPIAHGKGGSNLKRFRREETRKKSAGKALVKVPRGHK